MALITLLSPYSSVRGKTGGLGAPVAYPSGGRNFIRTLVNPDNPQTTPQTAIRAVMTLASQAYSSTTSAERLAWQTLNLGLTRKDANGSAYEQTTKGIYCAVNIYRQMDQQAITDVAPAIVTAPATGVVTGAEINIAGTTLSITLVSNQTDGFFFFRKTDALPGLARQARDGDYKSIDDFFKDAIVPSPGDGTQVIVFQVDDIRFPVSDGDRCGFEVTSISAGYVRGQITRSEFTLTQEV